MGCGTKMLASLCLYAWLTTCWNLYAQELRVRNVYGELLGPSKAYSINYDTRFKPTHNGFGMRVGIGFWTYSPQRFHRIALPIQLNYLTGKQRHHVEFGGGATVLHSGGGGSVWDEVSEEGLVVMGTLSAGYRYQPQRKGINARAGATLLYSTSGLPTVTPGVSLGYTFSN